jgi:hypothetical protein
MITPDIAGLCKRLQSGCIYMSDSNIDYIVNSYKTDELLTEAADTLERQAAEIKRLREALEKIASQNQPPRVGFDYAREIARAALTGEDT